MTTFNCILTAAFCALCSGNSLNAQSKKPVLEIDSYKKWEKIESKKLSNDGKYLMYTIQNRPLGSSTTVFAATGTNYRLQKTGIRGLCLTKDNKIGVFSENDTVKLLKLGTKQIRAVPAIVAKLSDNESDARWIAYQTAENPKRLNIKDLIGSGHQILDDINDFEFLDDGNILLCQTLDTVSRHTRITILDLPKNKKYVFSIAGSTDNFLFDGVSQKFAFRTKPESDRPEMYNFWVYHLGAKMPDLLWSNSKSESVDKLIVDRLSKFSRDAERLFVSYYQKKVILPEQNLVDLDIWSYKDVEVQPKQLKELEEPNYSAVITLKDSKLLKLQKTDEEIRFFNNNDDWVIVNKLSLYEGRQNQSFEVVSVKDSDIRKPIKWTGEISPDGKYFVYSENGDYFSQHIENGVIRNLTKSFGLNKGLPEDADFINLPRASICGWIEGSAKLLFYDAFDIWQIDMTGNTKPVNVTKGFGRKHQIIFSIVPFAGYNNIYKENAVLTLNAFNKSNKQNGFYTQSLGSKADPLKLSMEDALFWNPHGSSIGITKGYAPIKAKNVDFYTMERMTASGSPNFYVSKDLKSFKKISDVHPEQKYNWLKSELISWAVPQSDSLQGIMYKPENFDPTKKYPVIFYYYRKLSDNLNAYLPPEPLCNTGCTINIPTYVSNGYIVVNPDFKYKIGSTGDDALQGILSAVAELRKLPYIDVKRMGIQGCSFGGFQTNYIVSHTNIFAAASSASGLFDLVSAYNSVNSGAVKQIQFEKNGPYQIGGHLWDNRDAYVKNSPIFYADKVTTPLLVMQTTQDFTVPLANAVEFFTALRRLEKRVWMLQYNDGDHGISGKEAEDYSKRMMQFFDHYLKDAPPPKWMTEGRPAKLKNIDDRLELDQSGKQP